MKIKDDGSVVLFTPGNDQEMKFMKEALDTEPWQWLGKSLVVDHRYAEDLVELFAEEGFLCDD